jgi:hypothetical protein
MSALGSRPSGGHVAPSSLSVLPDRQATGGPPMLSTAHLAAPAPCLSQPSERERDCVATACSLCCYGAGYSAVRNPLVWSPDCPLPSLRGPTAVRKHSFLPTDCCRAHRGWGGVGCTRDAASESPQVRIRHLGVPRLHWLLCITKGVENQRRRTSLVRRRSAVSERSAPVGRVLHPGQRWRRCPPQGQTASLHGTRPPRRQAPLSSSAHPVAAAR